MNSDVITTLKKLAPATTVDAAWPPAAREAVLERVLAAPKEVPRRRRAIVLTTVLVPLAVGAVAAGAVLPQSFTNQLSFWSSQTNGEVDVETAQRAAQMPGPDGTVLSVWTATGKDGTTCVSPVFEAPGVITRPAPASFHSGGGTCLPRNARDEPFGDVSGSVNHNIHMMWGSAGSAVRAELRLADGTVRPAVSAEGMFFFWYFADRQGGSPTLVGYDAAGRVVGSTRLPNLGG